MISKRLAAGLLVAGCATAAASGGYLAVRQNAAEQPSPVVIAPPDVPAAAQPVSETEAIVAPATPPASAAPAPEPLPVAPAPVVQEPLSRPEPARRPPAKKDVRLASSTSPDRAVDAGPPAVTTPPPAERDVPFGGAPQPVVAEAPRPVEMPVEEPVAQVEEVILPASSVIGVRVETALSSERSQVEDRVEATVTREVTSAGRTAIPEGSRMLGSVTAVERGGKIKERARLGIRFHTLVLANGREIPIRTEAIYREGDSPSSESSRKIGGAAVGGAILGAILGGGKGAAIGGAAGAGAGTAAVMAGDRNAATLPAGTVVTVRLAAPATIEVNRR